MVEKIVHKTPHFFIENLMKSKTFIFFDDFFDFVICITDEGNIRHKYIHKNTDDISVKYKRSL